MATLAIPGKPKALVSSSLPCAALTSPSYGLQDALHRPRVTDGRTLSGSLLTSNWHFCGRARRLKLTGVFSLWKAFPHFTPVASVTKDASPSAEDMSWLIPVATGIKPGSLRGIVRCATLKLRRRPSHFWLYLGSIFAFYFKSPWNKRTTHMPCIHAPCKLNDALKFDWGDCPSSLLPHVRHTTCMCSRPTVQCIEMSG